MLSQRAKSPPPADRLGQEDLQRFISTPDAKQLIDMHAWTLARALSASTSSDSGSDAGSDDSSSDAGSAASSSSYTRLRALISLRDAAGGTIYFADGYSYAKSELADEFPELSLFDLRIEEAFVESICPGVWVETAHFAELRSLSAMRRAIRRSGLNPGASAVEVVRVLLGL